MLLDSQSRNYCCWGQTNKGPTDPRIGEADAPREYAVLPRAAPERQGQWKRELIFSTTLPGSEDGGEREGDSPAEIA